MNKSGLIRTLVEKKPQLADDDVAAAVSTLIESLTDALASGSRVEIRGFGSFSMRHRPAHMSRNPRTGEPIAVPPKHAVYFKPGRDLRRRVNASAV